MSRTTPRLVLLAATLMLSACNAGPSRAQVALGGAAPFSFAPLVRRVVPAVVNITVTEGQAPAEHPAHADRMADDLVADVARCEIEASAVPDILEQARATSSHSARCVAGRGPEMPSGERIRNAPGERAGSPVQPPTPSPVTGLRAARSAATL